MPIRVLFRSHYTKTSPSTPVASEIPVGIHVDFAILLLIESIPRRTRVSICQFCSPDIQSKLLKLKHWSVAFRNSISSVQSEPFNRFYPNATLQFAERSWLPIDFLRWGCRQLSLMMPPTITTAGVDFEESPAGFRPCLQSPFSQKKHIGESRQQAVPVQVPFVIGMGIHNTAG